MSNLTADQARALWEAGGFLVLGDLPEGSEYGIDGTFHLTRRFAGTKFVPPGLHLVTWSSSPAPTTTSGAASSDGSRPYPTPGPGALSVRHAVLRFWEPRQRVVLQYDPSTEGVKPSERDSIISDDHLRSLDPQLAAYPFDGLDRWKSLTTHISPTVLASVLPQDGHVDAMTPQEGEADEVGELDAALSAKFGGAPVRPAEPLHFVHFDTKRSWRADAVGEEVTWWSRDKSWQLAEVISRLENPLALLAQFQLAFILLLYVSSYASLAVYKRILTLFAQSLVILVSLAELEHLPANVDLRTVRAAYIELVKTLSAHLAALPLTAFEAELPEMDIFYLEQIQALRANLSRSIVVSKESWAGKDKQALLAAWAQLQAIGKERFSGIIPGIGECALQEMDEEDEEEEGEYAPQVVEM